jgi:hypothetical protein
MNSSINSKKVTAAKSVLSEENFTALQELDGNLCSLVNLAVEQFVKGLRENATEISNMCPEVGI